MTKYAILFVTIIIPLSFCSATALWHDGLSDSQIGGIYSLWDKFGDSDGQGGVKQDNAQERRKIVDSMVALAGQKSTIAFLQNRIKGAKEVGAASLVLILQEEIERIKNPNAPPKTATLDEQIAAKKQDLQRAREELRDTNERINSAAGNAQYKQLLADMYKPFIEAGQKQIVKLESEIKALEQQKAELAGKQKTDTATDTPPAADDIDKLLDDLIASTQDPDTAEGKSRINEMIQKAREGHEGFILFLDQKKIEWRIPPANAADAALQKQTDFLHKERQALMKENSKLVRDAGGIAGLTGEQKAKYEANQKLLADKKNKIAQLDSQITGKKDSVTKTDTAKTDPVKPEGDNPFKITTPAVKPEPPVSVTKTEEDKPYTPITPETFDPKKWVIPGAPMYTPITVNGKRYADMYELRKAAEKGDADAQYASGRHVSGTAKLDWLKKSAEQGNTDAQYMLGMCLFGGYATEDSRGYPVTIRNIEAGKALLKKAADKGHNLAKVLLSTPVPPGTEAKESSKIVVTETKNADGTVTTITMWKGSDGPIKTTERLPTADEIKSVLNSPYLRGY